MNTLAKLLIGFIAFIHAGILVLEMFLWAEPFVQNRFQNSAPEELAAILAGNQGLYNGFLAAGLIWGLLDKHNARSIWIFFLICIAIAGIYGSLSLRRPTAILLQTIPACFALLILVSEKSSALDKSSQ